MPETLTLKVLDELVALCATTVETIVLVGAVAIIAGARLTTVVEVIELVGKVVLCGTKEATELGVS